MKVDALIEQLLELRECATYDADTEIKYATITGRLFEVELVEVKGNPPMIVICIKPEYRE